MASQRPSGITIIAVAFIILGILSLIWSLIVFGFGTFTGVTGAIFGAENVAEAGRAGFWNGVFGIAGAILDFIVAFGLWNLRRWGWVLALIAVVINVITGVLGLFEGGFIAVCWGILGLIIPAAILFYLLRPDVRRAFGHNV
jgi:hypothetical protein